MSGRIGYSRDGASYCSYPDLMDPFVAVWEVVGNHDKREAPVRPSGITAEELPKLGIWLSRPAVGRGTNHCMSNLMAMFETMLLQLREQYGNPDTWIETMSRGLMSFASD
jgi:hypothetical protein